MPKNVSQDDLLTAIAWLDCNEGSDGESDACKRVADKLRAEYQRRLNGKTIREVSREINMPPALVSKLLTGKVIETVAPYEVHLCDFGTTPSDGGIKLIYSRPVFFGTRQECWKAVADFQVKFPSDDYMVRKPPVDGQPYEWDEKPKDL